VFDITEFDPRSRILFKQLDETKIYSISIKEYRITEFYQNSVQTIRWDKNLLLELDNGNVDDFSVNEGISYSLLFIEFSNEDLFDKWSSFFLLE
jgi:hypothetical protein